MSDRPDREHDAPVPRMQVWSRLAMKWNPFRVLEPHELPAVMLLMQRRIGLTEQDLLDSSERLIEVLGREGLGKTTTLQAMQAYLEGRDVPVVYHYLTPDRSDVLPAFDHRILLLDEIQRLRFGERRKLAEWLRSGQGRAICGTHRFWLPRGVAVRRIAMRGLDAGTVDEFFRKRVAYADADEDRCKLSADAAAWLAERLGALRGVEQLLYEVFQACENGTRTGGGEEPSSSPSFVVRCEHLRAAAPNLRRYKVRGPRRKWLPPMGLFSRRDQ